MSTQNGSANSEGSVEALSQNLADKATLDEPSQPDLEKEELTPGK